MSYPVCVVVALAQRGDRYLVGRRTGYRHAGAWEFPGGKVEPGEHPDAALIREMQEELTARVTVSELKARWFNEHYNPPYEILLYTVTFEDEPVAGDSHDLIDWRTLDDLTAMPEIEKVPSLQPLINSLLRPNT